MLNGMRLASILSAEENDQVNKLMNDTSESLIILLKIEILIFLCIHFNKFTLFFLYLIRQCTKKAFG